jgi:hypothetical protein
MLNIQKSTALLCLFSLLSLNACDDSATGSSMNEAMAGEAMAGTMMLAGETMAGTEMLAGDTMYSGTMAGMDSSDMGSILMPMAGDLIAGGMMAGETMAGTMVGGDMVGGEAMGGDSGMNTPNLCSGITDWAPVEQQGSIYLAHYLSSEVIQYRVDGEFPYEYGRFNVGGEPHDASLNAHQDLYAVALNLTQEVKLYGLHDVQENSTFSEPNLLATINTSPYTPRRVFFDSARQRMFVFGNGALNDEGVLEEMYLYIFDISTPNAPLSLSQEPFVMPVSTALAVEPKAGVLALVEQTTHRLFLYDVSGTTPIAHEGAPIDLRAAFPEDGMQAGFQIRNLRFDPVRGRLFMAREQGVASEVIAYQYPPVESKTIEGMEGDCNAVFTYSDLQHIPDSFEVALPANERANLLGAFMALPLIGEEFILFIAYAWRSTSIASMVSFMSDDGQRLAQLPACQDYEGFGCFYISYFGGNPSPYNHLTDGAGCVDQQYNVFAGVGLEDEENTSLFLFRFDRNAGTMSPLLTENGRNLSTAAYPLVLSCH